MPKTDRHPRLERKGQRHLHLHIGRVLGSAGNLGKAWQDQGKGQAAKHLVHAFKHPYRKGCNFYVPNTMNSHPPKSNFRPA